MSVFAIADLHFSFGTDKKMDIFSGWSNYENRIIQNWKELVSDNDTVIVPGDISWAMKLEESYDDLKRINELPGRKIFIKGNHDLWWGTKSKLEAFLREKNFDTISILFNNAYEIEDFAVCGSRGWYFDSDSDNDKKVLLRECGRIRMSVEAAKKINKEPVLFLHYPPVMRGRECEEIMAIIREEGIKRCYYGHLHGASKHNMAVTGEYKGINFNLISSDYLKFTPVKIYSK